MRTIKYRAWDKNLKKMYSNVCFDADNYAPRQLKSPEIDCLHFVKYDECELMQYTGLKDSKGVEIYEGDKTQYGTVEFSFGCWNINGDRELSLFKDIEVIGNIWEDDS